MKKFTEQLAQELAGAIEKNGVLMANIKAASDNGTFSVVATTQGRDRDGEIVLQEGLNIDNYMKNPVVLLCHDYWSLPIGMATKVVKNTDTGQTLIDGVFASEEANPVAQRVRRLYEAGILKAVSIGFIAKNWEGNVVTESELLELSFVPVPANPDALDTIKSLHLEEDVKGAFEYAAKNGVKLEGVFAKFFEDAKTTEPTEEPKAEKKEVTLAEVSEKVDTVSKQLNEFMETFKAGIEKLASNSKSEVKDEKTEVLEGAAQSEEMKALLGDAHKVGQAIATLANNLNKSLKEKIGK